MLTEGSDTSLSQTWDRFAPILPEGIITDMKPPEPLWLNLDHCIGNPNLIDGSGEAPDQKFFYMVEFHFATESDRQALLDHPDRDEIINTMEKYMSNDPGVTESFEFELERDQYLDDYPDAGPNSLNSGTISDLEVSVDEMIKSINETYGTKIQHGTVMKGSHQFEGCNPSSDAIPEDLASTDPDVKPASVRHAMALPGAGM